MHCRGDNPLISFFDQEPETIVSTLRQVSNLVCTVEVQGNNRPSRTYADGNRALHHLHIGFVRQILEQRRYCLEHKHQHNVPVRSGVKI